MCVACGAPSSPDQADSCAQTVLEVEGRIEPESSGLTCDGVRDLLGGALSEPGGFLIISKSPKATWKCHQYPSSGNSKDLISCVAGKRQFSILRL
jgi:hypothetical protein